MYDLNRVSVSSVMTEADGHFDAVITLLTGKTIHGDVYFSVLMTGSNRFGDFSIDPGNGGANRFPALTPTCCAGA